MKKTDIKLDTKNIDTKLNTELCNQTAQNIDTKLNTNALIPNCTKNLLYQTEKT